MYMHNHKRNDELAKEYLMTLHNRLGTVKCLGLCIGILARLCQHQPELLRELRERLDDDH